MNSRPTFRGKLGRTTKVLGAWVAIIAIGLMGIEAYVRTDDPNPFFFELDRLKVYNRKFYEQKRQYFSNWPIPLELFDADKPTPRYLFKPNLRMVLRGGRLDQAKSGEALYRSSNSWGFRGPEFPLKKPPGGIRIVCLGASTTEGSQGDLETYPHFLQQELNRRFPGRTIEVLNAGHHGQLIEDLLEILRQRVLPVDPDIVLFYEASNDMRLSEFSSVDLSCDPESCLRKMYQGVIALLHPRSALFQRLVQRIGMDIYRERPLWHRFDETSPKEGAVGYQETLRRIVQETLASGARIVLSSFVTVAREDLSVRQEDNPLLFEHLYRTRYPFSPGELERAYAYYNRIVRDVAVEFQVAFIDAASEFPRDVRYFPFDIIHFSPEGNRILAGIFASHLERKVLKDFVNPRAGR